MTGPGPAGGPEVPEGSVAAGNLVRLPRGAEGPFTVFVNGVRQQQGSDYSVRGEREIVFRRQILKEERVGFGRWLAMFIGLFGTYRTHETVDVEFRRGGRTELASDLPIRLAESPNEPQAHGGRSH